MAEASSTSRAGRWIDGQWNHWVQSRPAWLIALAVFLFAILLMQAYRPFTQSEGGDEAIWDYVAQSIVRGQIPYRDVVEIKTPGAAYLSVLGILCGRLIGVRDVLAIRALEVLLVGGLTSVVFLVAEPCLRNRAAALVACAIPLMSDHFCEWMAGGTEPKLAMILFGMLSLLFVIRARPFLAGFCSMLSFLCWQPGLLFAGVCLLVFSKYLTKWTDGRAAKALAGGAIPLLALVVYFYWRGALGDLWRWTIVFNYSVYAPRTARSLGDAAVHLWRIGLRVFGWDMILVAAGMIGFAGFFIKRFRSRPPGEAKESEHLHEAMLIAPLVYLIFCLINFQSGPDLIPLFPFIGVFAGAFLVLATGRVKNNEMIGRLALVLIVVIALGRGLVYRAYFGPSVQTQIQNVSRISDLLGPGEHIYVHGATEILVLLNIPNASPYIFFDWGKDEYIAASKGAGFESVLAEIESQAPKVVVLSRLQKVQHREEIERWVREHYDKLDVAGYPGAFLRKPR